MSLLVEVGVQVVMMNMLWVVLTVSSVALDVESTVRDVVPSGLRLVSQQDVTSIMPLEPSPNSLGEVPC